MRYRRAKIEGGTYFFTVVTYHRMKTLCLSENIELLKDAFAYAKKRRPFDIEAIALLPDHLHFILTLPPNDNDFPTRLRHIKSHFSRYSSGAGPDNNASRNRKREKAVWQRRYWEHVIRDEEDFIRHVDYIHYNPVKHHLVASPKDWKFSSFHHYVRKGVYDLEWGAGEELKFSDEVGHE